MTTVANCSSVEEALLKRSVLAGSGIQAYVPDELNAQNQPYVFTGAAVIRVQVDDEDADEARRVLAAPPEA